MTSVSKFANKAAKIAADNSPLILTALGVAGTVTTAVLASKASFRSAELIYGETWREQQRGNTLSLQPRDAVRLVWKEFIPAGVSLVGTVTCIICANRIGTRRAAAMAAAYAVSQETFAEYKTKVIEKIGENKERQVRDEIAQDRVAAAPAPSELLITDDMKVICYEMMTGRYFRSTMEEIKAAQNWVNYQILHNNYASLSDFYDRLGLNRTDVSEDLGWNIDEQLEITFSTTMTEDNRPCLAFSYKAVPIRNYFRMH